MGFILRILFSGLVVFIPSEDRQEVTVLLLNVPHQHQMSDGTSLDQHKPILIARGGGCVGSCPTNDQAVAEWIYPDKSASAALASLAASATGGGAWQLIGSDLTLRKGGTTDPDLPALDINDDVRPLVNGAPKIIPTTSTQREDFSWVADLKQLCPACAVDADVLAADPSSIVAARFTLRTGELSTYAIARIGSNVTPVHFKRLDDTGSVSSYTQAVASWVSAEIAVAGSTVEIVDEKFDGSPGRTMKLSPDANGLVEVALLNVPTLGQSTPLTTGGVGKHFEMFYDIADTPPTQASRLVPRAGAAPGAPSYDTVSWDSVHPEEELSSDLLTQLRLTFGRTVSEELLCPPSQNPRP
jgi:hypothetical protein